MQSRARKAFASGTVQDFDLALQAATGIPFADVRAAALRSVLRNGVASDPTAAAKHVAALSAKNPDPVLAATLASAMSSLTAAEQNLFLNQLPEGEMKEGIIGGLVRNATSKGNYRQAVAILNEMPDSAVRDHSLHDLAIKWGKADAKAVSSWIEQQPDSTDKDLIIAGYSHVVAGLDPQAAVKLAESIPDPKLKSGALRNIYFRWRVANAAEASAWLQNNPNLTALDKQVMERLNVSSSDLVLPPTVGNRR